MRRAMAGCRSTRGLLPRSLPPRALAVDGFLLALARRDKTGQYTAHALREARGAREQDLRFAPHAHDHGRADPRVVHHPHLAHRMAISPEADSVFPPHLPQERCVACQLTTWLARPATAKKGSSTPANIARRSTKAAPSGASVPSGTSAAQHGLPSR